jgi:hypothetical protein
VNRSKLQVFGAHLRQGLVTDFSAVCGAASGSQAVGSYQHHLGQWNPQNYMPREITGLFRVDVSFVDGCNNLFVIAADDFFLHV